MTCPKIRYRTRLDAQLALARCALGESRGNARRQEVRTYRCPRCGGWHLTSMERRPA